MNLKCIISFQQMGASLYANGFCCFETYLGTLQIDSNLITVTTANLPNILYEKRISITHTKQAGAHNSHL